MNIRGCILAVWLIGGVVLASGADWPQFLGPDRTGATSGEGLAEDWPKEGPPVLWRKAVGQGYAGAASRDGRVVLFHRVGESEVLDCLSADDGGGIWSHRYPAAYRNGYNPDHGPRAAPAIVGDRVFSMGANGSIRCLDFKTGKEVWAVEAAEEFGARTSFFGLACSPLLEGDAVMLSIGGAEGAGVIALARRDGKLLWKATDQEADYSAPTMATLHGRRVALFFLREGLFGLDPKTGGTVFKFPWRARIQASVNAATPVVVGNRIFLTSSYDTGDNLLEVAKDNGLKSVWSGDSFASQYATPIHKEGHLYGLAGRHDSREGTSPRCVDLATGRILWTKQGLKAAAMIMAGETLLVLRESGELVRCKATPAEPAISGRAQILGTGVRAQPALADGRFLARDTRAFVCVDLRAK